MCETMANIPVEDNSSYVLTEDMIDAAMTEQFAYQDDIESEEEELSSQDENMEVDQDTQGRSADDINNETTNKSIAIQSQTENVLMNPETASFNSASMSVLVIETGLDKNQPDNTDKSNDTLTNEVKTNNMLMPGSDKLKIVPNTKLNANSDLIVNQNKQPNCDLSSTFIPITQDETCKDGDSKLPILKKILSDKPAHRDIINIESIDLCDSETDEFSDDELTEVELIDDELKSVMESNLMAEVGMTLGKQRASFSCIDKTPDNSPPKIAVKSVQQIPSNVLNNTCRNNGVEGTYGTDYLTPNNKTINKTGENTNNSMSDVPSREKYQIPTSIHINKIAVPHQTFVTSHGQKMKCVYVRNPTTFPFIINSNQSSISNKNIKYMFPSQVKKGPVQLSPIAALTNMTKQNLQPQKSVQMAAKVLSVAPKLLKHPSLQNVSPRSHQFQDQSLDSLIKSLLFHNLKKPYTPPDILPTTVTYPCMDCSDRFILQSSLSQHLARRSVNIHYWCRICKTELQFFNRCVLLKHVRGHNNSIKHIDTTCITFSPVTKEMVDNGIASTFFKECISNMSLPSDECILQKATKNGSQTEETSRKSNINSVSSSEKTVSKKLSGVSSFNSSNQKITTVAGHSKSECFEAQSSALINKLNFSPALNSQHSKSILPPIIVPKKSMSVVQTLQKQTIEPSPAVKKQAPKSVILLCNKLPISPNVKQNTHINVIPPNVVCESVIRNPDDIFIDDDTCEKTNENIEDEEIDVEDFTVENNAYTDATSTVSCIKSDRNSTVKVKEKRPSKSLKRYCTECGVACLNIGKHLNGSNRPTHSDLGCEVCKLIMPTKCALKIHLRIHMKMAPYKCPDCGKDFSSWDEVHAHLKYSCGHLAKCVRYMCVSCKAHFPSITALGHHISSKHARDIYKCTSCPVAFFNKTSLKRHMSANHPNDELEKIDYKQCSLCPKKLVSKDKFLSHVQEHTCSSSVLIYGYKCPLCSVVFANKMAFIIHQIKEKSELEGRGDKQAMKKKALQSKTEPNKSHSNELNDNCIQDGIQVSDSNSDIEEEPEIIRKYPELNDESSRAEKDPLSLEGWEYNQEQHVKEKREELCIMCKRNSVVLLPGIDLNHQSLCCNQCVKPLDSHGLKMYMSNSTRNHLDNVGKRKRSTPKTVKRSSSCDEMRTVQKRRTSDVSLNDSSQESELCVEISDFMPAKKKSRKKQNKDKLDPAGQAHIQGQVITSKSPDELACSKCEFVADTRETFLEHITVHRSDPNTFQCLECGLCFVVLPSLERHLQMHHGIKDVSSYTEKNRSSLPQKVVLVEEDTDDNQCRVCYEMFDSGSSLEKHFRTHGMAFMSSLSKSPENSF